MTPPNPVGGVPDIVRTGLRVIFCGINPGLESGRLAQHFARPGNRFWKALYGSGSPIGFSPPPNSGLCWTSAWASPTSWPGPRVRRPTSRPTSCAPEQTSCRQRMAELQPVWLAVLGVQAYRSRVPAAAGQDRSPGRADRRLWHMGAPEPERPAGSLSAARPHLAVRRAAPGRSARRNPTPSGPSVSSRGRDPEDYRRCRDTCCRRSNLAGEPAGRHRRLRRSMVSGRSFRPTGVWERAPARRGVRRPGPLAGRAAEPASGAPSPSARPRHSPRACRSSASETARP